jgi:Ca-activated chloride channel family protein
MSSGSRLGTVKQALGMLVDQMRPDDSIAIAVYGTNASVALQPTSGADKARILAAINGLSTSGSTNVEDGLRVGFDLAERMYQPGAVNMLLLCSDGVANNGVTNPAALLAKYSRYTQEGIQLSTYGFGMGNYNDVLMEQMADKGNGRYAYVDTLAQARDLFVDNLSGSLQTIARDAKIQVEFNPVVVSHYRLLGYENRDVADRDFRNDHVDAGEVGAGHSVTALYEIARVPGASGTVAVARIRYQRETGDVTEVSSALDTASIRGALVDTTPRFQLATSVAQYAELLRNAQTARNGSLEEVGPLARRAAQGIGLDPKVDEFLSLLSRATALRASRR